MKENIFYKSNSVDKAMVQKNNFQIASRRAQDIMEVGERIRQFRKKGCISQEKLAELSGLTNNTIHRTEIGVSIIGIDNFFAIADALKVPIEELCPERFTYNNQSNDLNNFVFQYGRLNGENQKIVYETVMTLVNGLIVSQREFK